MSKTNRRGFLKGMLGVGAVASLEVLKASATPKIKKVTPVMTQTDVADDLPQGMEFACTSALSCIGTASEF